MCSTRQRLAALLREERGVMGLTLRQAAQRAQIAPSTLSRWESGTCVPRVPELEALLGALDMSGDSVRRILASLDTPRAARAVKTQVTENGDPALLAPTGGMLLRALRHKVKLSLTEVAHRLGVAPSTVSRWEAAATHPATDVFDALMELLQASPAERECLELSGVAKIKAKRRPYDADAFRSELCSIDATLASGGEEGTELRLLELQSELWWALRQPGAINLFRAAHIVYARFLLTWSRYHEAMEQSQAALESGEKWDDELGVAANRVLARADVYRWASPRPHLGLYVLQPLLHSLTEAQLRAPVLTEMAEYSRLAGRSSESLNYALRAVAVAGKLADSEAQFFAALALGLAHAAQQEPVRAFELLADAPTDTEPERAWRMIGRSEAHRRMDQTSEALRAYEDAQQFLSNHNLNHLQPALERAKEVVPGSIS